MTIISTQIHSLQGDVHVPGDKSISHRALMIASQAIGRSHIRGLLEGEDVLHTAGALRAMGVTIRKTSEGVWEVDGVGVNGLSEPDEVLDMGNSGTGARLLMGLVAPYDFTSFFTGDKSLCKRPMRRVSAPLESMGTKILSRSGGRLPLAVVGSASLLPLRYELPVASAQVKSAILFAGLGTSGATTVVEKVATRDHTENMLRHFGADVRVVQLPNGSTEITLTGQPELTARDIDVPGDPSSAAFLAVAALIVPKAQVTIRNICINPSRTGIYTTLQEMGAELVFSNKRQVAGEDVADIEVRASALKGITVPAERAPSMIDEYPVLAIAAAHAKGTTIMQGLEELKVKESNRLSAIAEGLKACGVTMEMGEDTLTVKGTAGQIPGGGMVVTHMDHRIAMSFLIMGMVSKQPVTVDDGSMIATSFPGFTELLNHMGAQMKPAGNPKVVKAG